MDQRKFLEDLQHRIDEMVKATPLADVQKNLRALLSKQFSEFHLVTREEFDAQRRVLARSREKLEALEQRLGALESLRHMRPSAARGAAPLSQAPVKKTAKKSTAKPASKSSKKKSAPIK